MSKVTLDMDTFKALASDTRLDILRVLDGKNMSLKDISNATKLNKATLHEHLTKLHEAGLIKRNGREGHKWVYYKLTWKGECLLHPENTRIVVLFTTTFIALWIGIVQFMWYIKGTVTNLGLNIFTFGKEVVMTRGGDAEKLKLLWGDGLYNTSGVQLPPNTLDFLKNFLTQSPSSMCAENYVNDSSSIPLGTNLSMIGTSNGMDALPKDTHYVVDKSEGVIHAVYQNPTLLYIAIACFILFTIVLCISLWRLWENKTPKL